MTGPLLPHTGIDPIQELLFSVCGLTSVITNFESKQEQQYMDIQKLKEKQVKPNYPEHFGTPNLKFLRIQIRIKNRMNKNI
jgi:hypothetical protein